MRLNFGGSDMGITVSLSSFVRSSRKTDRRQVNLALGEVASSPSAWIRLINSEQLRS